MKTTLRNAFSMVELLFVIVILGIVGGIALETIRQYYENIYRTQEYTKRVAQADHVLEQVSKYFENGISSSIVNFDGGACVGPPTFGDAADHAVVFVAADADSLNTIGAPGWSEDTRLTVGTNALTALDADYTSAGTIMTGLGSSLNNSAIYDAGSTDIGACNRFYNGTQGYHTITGTGTNTLTLATDNNATDGKRKYLLRTGYGFEVDDDGVFRLYSNFRPWAGTNYTAAAKQNVLAENVAHFYVDYDASDFMANDNVNDRGLVWRLKVCMRGLDNTLTDTDLESQTICRERRVHVRY